MDPLAARVVDRRSRKEPSRDQDPPAAVANELELYAAIYTDAPGVAVLKAVTRDALLTEARTRRTLQESVHLMRFGKAEINASPDDIDLGGPFLENLMLAGCSADRVSQILKAKISN